MSSCKPIRTGWRSVAVLSVLAIAACQGENRQSSGGSEADLDASNPQAPYHVSAVEPEGAVEHVGGLFVRFAEAVVPKEQVGKDLDQVPLRTNPPLKLKGRWLDVDALGVDVLDPVPPGTRVTVTFAGPLAGKTDRPSFWFSLKPPRLTDIWPDTFVPVTPGTELMLKFDRPVPAEDAARRCRLLGPNEARVAWKLWRPEGGQEGTRPSPDRRIRFVVTEQLRKDTTYRVVCGTTDGQDEGGGDTVVGEASFRTHGNLRVTTFDLVPSEASLGAAPDPDRVEIRIDFTTPVDENDLREHLHIRPKPPHEEHVRLEAWRTDTGGTARVHLRAAPLRDYVVRIDPNLKDEFGQRLGKEAVLRFTTGAYVPKIVFHRGGPRVLDIGAPGFEVAARSLRKLGLRCGKVPAGQLARVLVWGSNWIGPEALKPGTPEREYIARRFARHRHELTLPGEGWTKRSLKLPELCGGGRGLFALRLDALETTRDDVQPKDVEGQGEALVNVTDLGVFGKVGATRGLVWVVRLSDGQPVPSARVTFYRKGRPVFTGRTDAQGVARLPGARRLQRMPKDADPWDYDPDDLWVVVQTTDDVAAMRGGWNDGIEGWQFDNVDTSSELGEPRRLRAFMQTDRGLYRPGEKVRFHGFVRVLEPDGALGMAPPRGVAVKVTDSQDRIVAERKLRLSRYGSFHFTLPLSETAPVGVYQLELTALDQRQTLNFRVEEFRRATMEVTLQPTRRDVPNGEPIEVEAVARFLYGAPAAAARVRWSVRERPWWPSFPNLGWGFTFLDYVGSGYSPWYHGDGEEQYLTEEEGRTDAKGVATFRWTPRAKETPRRLLVTAEVTPEGERPVSKTTSVVVHPSDRYVGLRTEQWVVEQGEPLGVELALVRLDGTPLQGEVRLRARTCKKRRPNTWRLRDCLEWDQAVDRTVRTDARGRAGLTIRLPRAGTWALFASTKDGRGKEILASDTVWVSGNGADWWGEGGDEHRMTLVPSKAHFAPGEQARLLPLSRLKHTTALLTVERRGVLRHRVEALDDPGRG